jgi:hypothetical protein
MPEVGLEPTIPAFERARTIHALDRTATVIGNFFILVPLKFGKCIALYDVKH